MNKNKKIKIKVKEEEIKYQDPFNLYCKLTSNGENISLLMESRSLNLKYGKQSIVVPNPVVRIEGKNEDFKIKALTSFGEKILGFFKEDDFDYVDNLEMGKKIIKGKVKKEEKKNVNEDEKKKLKNVSFVLKTILNKFECGNSLAGLYGAFAYDFARNFYAVGERFKDKEGEDFVLFIPSEVYFFDDIKEKAKKLSFVFNGEEDKLKDNMEGFEFKKKEGEIEFDLNEKEYLDRVSKIVKDIKNGRVMQCVLSRELSAPLKKHPIDSYKELREINPSPYSFFYNLGGDEILYGASPEKHISIEEGEIEIRPIAGTIVRSENPLEDARARIDLLTDEKELREHTMLVDLARHELYYLCDSESVFVSDLFTIEKYPNLYHLVSGVKGKLKKGVNAIESLLVTLPAGTLSGAPKLEAMKMIEEYEGSRRNFYGGTIGYLAFNGNCNTGITIRSIHVKKGNSFIRAGGGVVALSTPERELKESKLKMEKTIRVLGVEL